MYAPFQYDLPRKPLITYFRKLHNIKLSKEVKKQLVKYTEKIIEKLYVKLGIILCEIMPMTKKRADIEHWEKL